MSTTMDHVEVSFEKGYHVQVGLDFRAANSFRSIADFLILLCVNAGQFYSSRVDVSDWKG